MRVSLRVISTLTIAGLVCVVALASVAITYSFSLAALRDTGKAHARSNVNTLEAEIRAYVSIPIRQTRGLQYSSLLGSNPMPVEQGDGWHVRWERELIRAFAESGFVYQGLAVAFQDSNFHKVIQATDTTLTSIALDQKTRAATGLTTKIEVQMHLNNLTIVPERDHFDVGQNIAYNPLTRGYYINALKSRWAMKWESTYFTVNPTFLVVGLTGALYNSTNDYLGVSLINTKLSFLSDYLFSLRTTVNTHSIMLDQDLFLLATSYHVPYLKEHEVPRNDTSSPPGNCFRSPPSAKESLVSCRYSLAEYPFAELQDLTHSHPEAISSSAYNDIHTLDGSKYYVVVQDVDLEVKTGMVFKIILLMPETDIIGEINKGRVWAILATLGVLVVADILTFVAVFTLLQPLKTISRRMQETARFHDSAESGKTSMFSEVADIQYAFEEMKARLMRVKHYLPHSILGKDDGFADMPTPFAAPNSAAIMRSNSEMEMAAKNLQVMVDRIESETSFQRRKSTIVYFDLANLPTHDSALSVDATSRFTRAVIPFAMATGGVVDNLHADNVLVSYNCHSPCVLHEEAACTAAVNASLSLMGEADLNVTIAIATGYNLVGTCGTDDRRARVIAGEAVDLVQKMPSLQRMLGCSVVATEDVVAAIEVCCAPLDAIAPTWFQENRLDHVVLYELLPETYAGTKQLQLRSAGFRHLRQGELDNAMSMFHAAAKEDQADQQITRLLQSCAFHKEKRGGEFKPRKELAWETKEVKAGKSTMVKRFLGGTTSDNGKGLTSSTDRKDISTTLRQQLLSQQTRAECDSSTRSSVAEETAGEEEPALFQVFMPDSDAGEGDDGEIPKQMEDSSGGVWIRSDTVLGKGAFASVYMVIGQQGTLAAMKVFRRDSNLFSVEEAIKEVSTLSQLRHDNVVGYVSCAVLKSYFGIVTEYVSGGSLHSLINQFGPLPMNAAVRYTIDIVRGLKCLHSHSIIHRDVKPHNCLLANDGTCKLSDFGASIRTTVLDDTAQTSGTSKVSGSSASASQPSTAPGRSFGLSFVNGTPRYMAPEACAGEATYASDIWSLGITLVEILTGRLPWSLRVSDAVFLQRLGKDEKLVPEIPAVLPPPFRPIVEACLRRNPAQRPSPDLLLQMVGSMKNQS